ncbi:TPA: ATP-binding domain-containing protein [Burkholderia cepacia ATCC 25416]|uniref:ATP-binding domain-containing protein n=1 Tax=Burkholderia cepacia TaxID=292 RepID=UPI001CF416F7|nr:ATP-binding domain-containing protein [Burkholderia cepacia]HDR9764616.1 ATP-binding domain-containing protein [Burkholderia cepacia ATCC 25416]MCA8077171.1 ATP-binding domain-containing protein [Burkholderia cepacia]HDR9773670.1 ATP-binding domain-containing protein [Burkholderia cepacia ATCC 25416]HDR9781982.1 ATP-binding domain-containing protein [Burkholderia cepacia ATCC 25416]HDR9788899.1 ATP-binding domain-containing protein [Burkholderia cepacia ATCC 25416]
MARLIPDDWKSLAATGAAERERETLAALEHALPDGYTVYHGVHWTRADQAFSVFGEAAFVVVSPAGRVLLIEQKAGFLRETPKGLVKVYLQKERNVPIQLARTQETLHRRLTAALGAGVYGVEALLYCPDYSIRDASIAGVAADRIVDASRKAQLAQVILRILPEDDEHFPNAPKLHHFLADELALTPDTSALVGQAGTLVTRLSGGLAAWARQLEFAPFRLRVTGTAGSGKTQLAVQAMRDAVAAGKRVLYVCFNRPLADYITRIAPPGAKIANYHQLCDWVARDGGYTPDFQVPGEFERLEARFAQTPISERWRFDVLVVDEGQDFHAPWAAALERLLVPGGAWWWLEDPLQNLYMREPVALPGWVTLKALTNYRSPRDLLEFVRDIVGRVEPLAAELRSGSPFDGSDPSVSAYGEEGASQDALAEACVDATKRAITHALSLGFRKQDIAVLSYRGREGSVLAPLDQLGPHRLKSFTGKYDLFGNPEYREGDVLLDSIYRFKGQSAPCVILTEVDFDTLDARAARKLFVGATRATMKLLIVASSRAAAQLAAV